MKKAKQRLGLIMASVLIFSLLSPTALASAGSGDFVVENGALTKYIGSDTEVVIPDNLGITAMGDRAFAHCESVTSVVIPDGVTEIGCNAFEECYGLQSVTIPESVREIGGEAFKGCGGLTSVTIPDSVTSIGEGAFFACGRLKSVAVGRNLKTIGAQAFYACGELRLLALPDSVTFIGESAFEGCNNLTISAPEGSFAQQYATESNIPFESVIFVEPVQFILSVNGEGMSLWAYEIDGGVYFKLRDLAMALNGTDKQFGISWIPENKEVDLIPGYAYTPVGGELSKPDRIGTTAARYTDYSIRSVNGWGNVLAYLVDDADFVKLSDLAAVMKFASVCDEKKNTAEIDTTPDVTTSTETGDAFDNIALTNAGNSYSLDEDGNVILYYKNSEIKSKAPLVLQPAGSDYASGQSVDEAGFYISKEKTAIAYGGLYGDPVYVITSEDMGKTWEKSEVIARNVEVSQLYVGFNTQNDGWLVVCNFHGMGYEDNYIYRTADGGKTWTQIGNPNDIYARVITGAGFATSQIGFLSYRYEFKDFEPAICRTLDGGYTWEKLYVKLPEEFDDYSKTPLSPVFHGADGLYPIKLSNRDGDHVTIYLKSADYGKTWTYDEAYNLAQMWAQAVQNRDGRAQYKLLSSELQAESYDGYVSFDWVTGASSPWVDDYTVKLTAAGAVITYKWASSTGPDGVSAITLAFVRENGVLRIGGFADTPIEADFTTDSLYNKKLPILDKAQVSNVLQERTEDGITQALYRKAGDDWQYYSYLTIGGVSYDLGYMGYGLVGDSILERWGINKTQVTGDSPVYILVRLNGIDYVSSAYLKAIDGVPYLLYEFDGWGIQKDIDGDGSIETTANAGVSTWPDYILYEWDMGSLLDYRTQIIRHVRLKEMLNCNVARYDSDENLFYAENRDNETGKWVWSAYEYEDGKFIEVKEENK